MKKNFFPPFLGDFPSFSPFTCPLALTVTVGRGPNLWVGPQTHPPGGAPPRPKRRPPVRPVSRKKGEILPGTPPFFPFFPFKWVIPNFWLTIPIGAFSLVPSPGLLLFLHFFFVFVFPWLGVLSFPPLPQTPGCGGVLRPPPAPIPPSGSLTFPSFRCPGPPLSPGLCAPPFSFAPLVPRGTVPPKFPFPPSLDGLEKNARAFPGSPFGLWLVPRTPVRGGCGRKGGWDGTQSPP